MAKLPGTDALPGLAHSSRESSSSLDSSEEQHRFRHLQQPLVTPIPNPRNLSGDSQHEHDGHMTDVLVDDSVALERIVTQNSSSYGTSLTQCTPATSTVPNSGPDMLLDPRFSLLDMMTFNSNMLGTNSMTADMLHASGNMLNNGMLNTDASNTDVRHENMTDGGIGEAAYDFFPDGRFWSFPEHGYIQTPPNYEQFNGGPHAS